MVPCVVSCGCCVCVCVCVSGKLVRVWFVFVCAPGCQCGRCTAVVFRRAVVNSFAVCLVVCVVCGLLGVCVVVCCVCCGRVLVVCCGWGAVWRSWLGTVVCCGLVCVLLWGAVCRLWLGGV